MSSLFSTMRNDFIPASSSLMPMQSPENPAPTMRTWTFVTADSGKPAAASVMRVSSLPCWIPWAQRNRGETPHSLGVIGVLRESGTGRAARHAVRLARFSVGRKRQRLGHVQRGGGGDRAEIFRPPQGWGEGGNPRKQHREGERGGLK